MATRTISPAGGNWNATSSWVEGIVPTSSDFVVGNSSSGNLTFNVAAICQGFDCTDYNATFSWQQTISLGSAGFASTFSNTMTFEGNFATSSVRGLRVLQNHTFSMGSQSRIPMFTYAGTSTRTLVFNSDFYVVDFLSEVSGSVILNTDGNKRTLDVSRHIGAYNPTDGRPLSQTRMFQQGLNQFIELSGEGTINVNASQFVSTNYLNFIISGSYSVLNNTNVPKFGTLDNINLTSLNTNGRIPFVMSVSPAAFTSSVGLIIATGGSLDAVVLGAPEITWSSNTNNGYKSAKLSVFGTLNSLYLSGPCIGDANQLMVGEFQLGNTISVDEVIFLGQVTNTWDQYNFWDTTNSRRYSWTQAQAQITGAGISASRLVVDNLIFFDFDKTNERRMTGQYIALDPRFQYNFDKIYIAGGYDELCIITSSVATSSQVQLIVADGTSSVVNYVNFTNIDASGGATIYNLMGTFSNSSNISTTFPTTSGGTGSQPSPQAYAFLS